MYLHALRAERAGKEFPMFESAVLGRSYPAKEYDEMEKSLRMKLFTAQRESLARKLPVLVLIAGVDGTGRGAVANMLSEWMDAKSIRNHVFWMQTDEERCRPAAWKYWTKLPGQGEWGVFTGGWYGGPIRQFCCGGMEEERFNILMHRWARLEQALAASGTIIVKLWLHLSKKAHKERRKERLNHQEVHHFTPYDKKSAKDYDSLIAAAAKAITLTDRVEAPWTIIDAYDANFRNASVARTIITAIENALAEKAAQEDAQAPLPIVENEGQISALDAIDLSQTCERGAYRKELAQLQADIYELTYKAYKKGISSTLLFEGWDAAGKGGAIRRLTAGVDARITRVIPISAPTDEELAHHYLWRFWRHVPRAGFVTVYDRSWYGRVLVERVEKLAPPAAWKRAYAEINDFEEQLQENNNVVLKYWLHISPEEQLRRFKEREEIPWKNYKITPDDWRNRERWDDYAAAADEMFVRTSTEYAPWHIIPAEDKKYARLEVLRIYKQALMAALDEKKKEGAKKKG